ncbi:MAG: hypothetical protein HWQ38_23150 [Nostoc sp. NMS7]|uniref:hypothetical protein n=1 Tax=Nostoc sp. NMS7 TaxID=2815391 RepID=UPI0025FE9151|nr:hypothetical protein [Nostoc sp. NMS7]MBN3949199.1 hypothetical protein [Nostoc sp. NMS7]
MPNQSRQDFKSSLKRILGRYYGLAGIIVFLVGVLLRLAALGKTGFFWDATKDIGTFLAVAVAIPFFYEKLIKSEEHQLFLTELEELLDSKFPNYKIGLKLYEDGRPSISEKVDLLLSANSEVVSLGIAHRSLVGYFEQRPAREYKDYILDLLRKGVVLKYIFLDPDGEIAKLYAQDRGEVELINRIRTSLDAVKSLKSEFDKLGLPGRFEIYISSTFPYISATCIDVNEVNGRMLIAPYLYGIKRAEVPHFHILKTEHEVMFETYWKSIREILANSRQV